MKPNPQQQHAQMSQQESMSNIRQSEVDEILDVDLGIEWIIHGDILSMAIIYFDK